MISKMVQVILSLYVYCVCVAISYARVWPHSLSLLTEKTLAPTHLGWRFHRQTQECPPTDIAMYTYHIPQTQLSAEITNTLYLSVGLNRFHQWNVRCVVYARTLCHNHSRLQVRS